MTVYCRFGTGVERFKKQARPTGNFISVKILVHHKQVWLLPFHPFYQLLRHEIDQEGEQNFPPNLSHFSASKESCSCRLQGANTQITHYPEGVRGVCC